MDRMKKLHTRIDWLDSQIASLLNERMRAVDQIGNIKREKHQNVTDQSREKNVLNQVEMIVQHPVLKANIANIYREIMQESRIAQQFFHHLTLPFQRIGLIGLGLIGGSICKALKMKDPSIQIATLIYPSEDYTLAEEGGWIDRSYSSLLDLTQNIELLILASPISTITSYAEEIKIHAARLEEKLTVIDLASVKEGIATVFQKSSCENMEFIATHPMSGKEKGGFTNSQATLFVNRPWIITPHDQNTERGIESIKELIQFLGSEPICLEASAHDRQAALISHLPSLLSKSYFDFVNSIDPQSIAISGPGFQSFTRLAHGNSSMRSEITQCNKKNIHLYLLQWLEYLTKNKGHL